MKLDTNVLQALAPADDLSPATTAEAWLFACDARWMAGRAARAMCGTSRWPSLITEYPFYGSSGCETTGHFRAAVARARAARPKRITSDPRGPPCNA